MVKLFTPFSSKAQHRNVHVADVSKEQLARTVNEQSARIKELDGHIMTLGRVLLAITQEPEAFHYLTGSVYVDSGALMRVLPGTQLTFAPRPDGGVTLGAVKPEKKSDIEVPRILVPSGGR